MMKAWKEKVLTLKDVPMLELILELMTLQNIICIINSWLLIQCSWSLDLSIGHSKLEAIIKKTSLLLMENFILRNTMRNSINCGHNSQRMNLNMPKIKPLLWFRKDIKENKLHKKLSKKESPSIQTTLGASNENENKEVVN